MPSDKANNVIQFPGEGAPMGVAVKEREDGKEKVKPNVARAVVGQGKVQAAAIIGKDMVN